MNNLLKWRVRKFCEFVPKFKSNLSADMETAKKQTFWRIRNIGQLELEFIVMKWYEKQNLSYDELKKFSEEVLEMENPEMNKYFVQFEAVPENLIYTQKIQNYVLNK
jgi:succinate dehydrogenase flavin-adding protein (antitoxin of CptAB toxin-antitoxin module)